jgi:hypothetical protein
MRGRDARSPHTTGTRTDDEQIVILFRGHVAPRV